MRKRDGTDGIEQMNSNTSIYQIAHVHTARELSDNLVLKSSNAGERNNRGWCGGKGRRYGIATSYIDPK